jgi:hypothetical protein
MVELKPVEESTILGPREMEKAFQASVRRALIFHKSIGNPIAASEDGKVVWIAPEDIVIPDE